MSAGVVAAALAGALSWSFLEYVIHRWWGHDRRFRRTPFGVEHVRHHIEGDYFAPTWKKLLFAAAVAAVLAGPAVLLGAAVGLSYLAGLLGFYGVYELVHRRLHTHAGIGRYGRFLRRHHFRHHLVDARTNHGVTSPLWDHVFGTWRRAERITVPPRLAMVWLVDPATGRVRPEHAATYVVGKGKAG
ncbi:MAG TPA: sterol desaturase family protein [Kofleriaceae bacterium]|nr:sterol desaturase family protein [Kofleriaceae bacterium]